MLKVERLVNELMASNCYVIYEEDAKRCLVIDPGSEKSLREIEFIENHALKLDKIIITHEHTDHNWGVNALKEHFPDSKLLCSEACGIKVKKTNRAYFLLYYDNIDCHYEIAQVDKYVSDGECIEWSGYQVIFLITPGHSVGSVCIDIDGMLFTGDTIMPFKPYLNGRDGNREDWCLSINKVLDVYSSNTIVYPGHGDILTLGEWRALYGFNAL